MNNKIRYRFGSGRHCEPALGRSNLTELVSIFSVRLLRAKRPRNDAPNNNEYRTYARNYNKPQIYRFFLFNQ